MLERVLGSGASRGEGAGTTDTDSHLRPVQRPELPETQAGLAQACGLTYLPPLGGLLWQAARQEDLESLISPDGPEGTF